MFYGNSACEIASPVPVFDICVREEIICFHWVSLPLGVKFGEVHARCRVEEFHFEVGFFWVYVIDELVDILISHLGIRPFEIRPHGVHQDVASIMQWLVPEVLNELAGAVVEVIPFEFFIIDDGLSVSAWIKIESWRRLVVVVLNVSEYWSVEATLLNRVHDHFHSLILKSNFLVLVVDTSKEPGVKAHLADDGRLSGLVAKCVDVPSDGWPCTKGVVEESINDVVVLLQSIFW